MATPRRLSSRTPGRAPRRDVSFITTPPSLHLVSEQLIEREKHINVPPARPIRKLIQRPINPSIDSQTSSPSIRTNSSWSINTTCSTGSTRPCYGADTHTGQRASKKFKTRARDTDCYIEASGEEIGSHDKSDIELLHFFFCFVVAGDCKVGIGDCFACDECWDSWQ